MALACVLAAMMVTAGAPAAATESTPTRDSVALEPSPRGPYYTLNVKSGKAMAVQGNSRAHGAPVVQWSDDGGHNNDLMIWEFETSAPQVLRLKPFHTWSSDGNPHNDMCLAVEGASTARGARIVQATCTYDSVNNDVWFHHQLSDDLWEFRNHNSRLCIVVEGASENNGARLIQHNCYQERNTTWYTRRYDPR